MRIWGLVWRGAFSLTIAMTSSHAWYVMNEWVLMLMSYVLGWMYSLIGGNHFRVYRQNGTEADSGALFLAYVLYTSLFPPPHPLCCM